MNIIPKTGGNTFTGHFFGTGLNGTMQSDNFTQRLIDAGLRRPNRINYIYDTSVSSGGPIIKDRLWYFSLVYYRGSGNDISMFHNLNAGDITKWTYVADPNNPAKSDSNGPLQPNLRLTFQVSPRNKLNLFWDEQISSDSIGQGSSDTAPGNRRLEPWLPARAAGQVDVDDDEQAPARSRRRHVPVQLEHARAAGQRPPTDSDHRTVPGLGRLRGERGISGLTYHGMNTWNADWIGAHTWNAAASYVTGTHNMKFGYQGAYHADNRAPGGKQPRFGSPMVCPNQLTQRIVDYRTLSRVPYYAFYAQDQWTRGRLTLQGAVRFDHPWSTYPEQSIGGVQFLPAVTTFPESRGVEGYNDITPRMGLGLRRARQRENGHQVQHGPVSRGGGQRQRQLLGAAAGVARADQRDANLDRSERRLRSGLRSAEPAGPDDNRRLLRPDQPIGVRAEQSHALLRPADHAGLGRRPGDWQIGATLQHEVLPRVSIEVGYLRRWLQNFTVTDNRAQAASDFGSYSVTAPIDPRLPGGGGYVVSGLYNANPNVVALTDNYRTYAPNYGNQYSIYNGLELSVNARLRNGVQLQAGSSTGSQVTDDCEVRAALPEVGIVAGSSQATYCHNAPGIRTRATAAGSYTIPKIDVLLSGTFQSSPGVPLAANYVVTSAVVAQSLGRPLSNNATNVTINLLKPGDVFGERVNQLDFRVGKVLRFGRQRATISADLFNALNSDAILDYNQGYSPTANWPVATSVLTARSTKITVQWDF